MQIGIRADLVERAAQEQLVGGDAVQIERARRHQEDLVGRRRQVVLAVAAVLEIRVDRLARLLEVEDRVADLLHLAPERRLEAGRLQQHGADARVDLGLAQIVDDRPHGRRLRAAQVADDVGRRDLGEVAADAQHQHGVGRDGGLAPDQHIQQHEAGDRDEERDAEQREDDGESAASHVSELLLRSISRGNNFTPPFLRKLIPFFFFFFWSVLAPFFFFRKTPKKSPPLWGGGKGGVFFPDQREIGNLPPGPFSCPAPGPRGWGEKKHPKSPKKELGGRDRGRVIGKVCGGREK